jgi:signal transduction histidine kinase
VHRGKVLGLLLAERAPAEPPFSEEDDRVLGDLARQVGTALRNVQLDSALEATVDELRARNAELQGSRARLVAVADAERRRLERDLHDGAQQHLTALGVKLELAAALAGDDPVAKASFAELRVDLDEARAQLRALAHGIFPPLLTIGGLPDALPHLASRAPLPVTVGVPSTRWDAEAEAAVYFCCSEALQNVAKHAGPGARASVRVWEDAGALRFSVHDDGAGFATTGPASAPTSRGLVNMADRLGAIGGELTVASAPGAGTTVAGCLPLPAAAPATPPGP